MLLVRRILISFFVNNWKKMRRVISFCLHFTFTCRRLNTQTFVLFLMVHNDFICSSIKYQSFDMYFARNRGPDWMGIILLIPTFASISYWIHQGEGDKLAWLPIKAKFQGMAGQINHAFRTISLHIWPQFHIEIVVNSRKKKNI